MSSPAPRPAALPFAALLAAGVWLGLLGLCVVTLVAVSGRAGAQGSPPALAGAVTLTFRPPEGTLAPARRDLSGTLPAGAALLTELANSVEFRASSADPLGPAYPGLVLGQGGELQTGSASAARLDFDDGSVVRLGENTLVSLEVIAARAGDPATRLGLQDGQVWANLRSRPLEVGTLLGAATAYGAFAEFVYQPGESGSLRDDELVINCFKGPCSFTGIGVNEFVGDLTRLTITGLDRTATAEPLTAADVQTFIRNNPEGQPLLALVGSGPAPTQPPAPSQSPAETEPQLPTLQPPGPAYPGETFASTATLPATPAVTTPTASATASQSPSPTVSGTPPTPTPTNATPGTPTDTGTPGTPTATGTLGTPTPTLTPVPPSATAGTSYP